MCKARQHYEDVSYEEIRSRGNDAINRLKISEQGRYLVCLRCVLRIRLLAVFDGGMKPRPSWSSVKCPGASCAPVIYVCDDH